MDKRTNPRASRAIRPTLALGAWLLAGLPAYAADGLDVKIGLWETTMTTARKGPPPMPPSMLAKLSPEQRARIQAAAQKEAASGPQSHVYKSCVTAQDIKNGAFRADEEEDEADCVYKVVSQTRTLQQATKSCSGEMPLTSTLRIEALDREHVKGSMLNTVGPSTITAQLSARWLGADCKDADKD